MRAKPLSVHVLYESSGDGVPHGCSFIRLLRPLTHPSIESELIVSNGFNIPNRPIDILVIERLWDYTCDWQRHLKLLETYREQGTKIIFEIDDDLLNVNTRIGDKESVSVAQQMWLRQMIKYADGVLVSTPRLANRLARLNPCIEVVENALDERLFDKSRVIVSRKPSSEIVFGYMGTFTHLDDLLSIVRPLRTVLARYRGQVRFEIIGVGDNIALEAAFSGLPVKVLTVPAQAVQYEGFCAWIQENVRWDFGIAPLLDTSFSRSKSDIKFLDYGVQGVPGIFADVPAYNATIKHLENGILVNDIHSWEVWLQRLIVDEKIRSALASQAHHDVWSKRMLDKSATNWVAALRALASSKGSRRARGAIRAALKGAKVPIPLSRSEKLLYGCNLHGIGLEIGPSYCPVAPKRAGYRVEILDHADAASLREKYKDLNVDVSNIEDVDYVWSGEPLHELTGKTDYYDWIVASHVIEHTPDLVSFLQQCETMLKPEGFLCLAVPDHRYCFDVFRPASTPGDVIQAYAEKRQKHTLGAIWDHFSMIVKKGNIVAWHRGYPGKYNFIHPDIDDARSMLARAQESGEYLDVHNWRFTPSSFKLIINDLAVLEYSAMSVSGSFETEGHEFIVQLKKCLVRTPGESTRKELLRSMLKESLDSAVLDG